MPRTLPEWIGKTPDTKVPKRVRQRVYDAHNGTCHICELPIKTAETWHLDHLLALIMGGENREKNLAPAHAHCNLKKANDEKAAKAKVAKIKGRHTGATRPKGQLQGRGFSNLAKAKSKLKSLPPKRLYQERGAALC